jgi:hypothetical protein
LAGAPPGARAARWPGATSLTGLETATLSAWCDTLAPGAAGAGVGDFVNAQLAKRPEDALLGIRYFDVPAPYLAFYREGLRALDRASKRIYRRAVPALNGDERQSLLARLLAGDADWSGPPFFLFYLVTRSDAVDVLYGTPSGFARIGYRYEPVVSPPSRW